MQDRELTITITGKYRMPEDAESTSTIILDTHSFRDKLLEKYPGLEFTVSDEPHDGSSDRMVARCPICSGVIMQGLIYEPENTKAVTPTKSCILCKTAISVHHHVCPSCNAMQVEHPVAPPSGIPH